MKVFMTILSLVFVSCVTANPRDLSAVNHSPAVVLADNQFEGCLSDCTKRGGLLVVCSDSCLKLTKAKPKIKMADYATCMQSCREDLCDVRHDAHYCAEDSRCAKYCSE